MLKGRCRCDYDGAPEGFEAVLALLPIGCAAVRLHHESRVMGRVFELPERWVRHSGGARMWCDISIKSRHKVKRLFMCDVGRDLQLLRDRTRTKWSLLDVAKQFIATMLLESGFNEMIRRQTPVHSHHFRTSGPQSPA